PLVKMIARAGNVAADLVEGFVLAAEPLGRARIDELRARFRSPRLRSPRLRSGQAGQAAGLRRLRDLVDVHHPPWPRRAGERWGPAPSEVEGRPTLDAG